MVIYTEKAVSNLGGALTLRNCSAVDLEEEREMERFLRFPSCLAQPTKTGSQ